jgi:tripartite-type tricarboxylate transporter receptor subunit TctC
MKRVLATLWAVLVLSAPSAFAQNYPTRPVTLIVPFAAGGPTDIVARIVGEYFSKTLGQQFIIENIAGAGGTTGIARGAQAKPDGYHHDGSYGHARRGSRALSQSQIRPGQRLRTDRAGGGHADLIVARRISRPGPQGVHRQGQDTSTEAQPGACRRRLGVVHHLHAAGPRSSASSITASWPTAALDRRSTTRVGGQVDYMCDQIVNLVEQVKGGAIKAYAIATAERSPALPDVPTSKEAGLPEYEVSAWNALFAPKGTPKEIVTKLNQTLVKALDDPATRKRLLDLGSVLPQGNERSPEALAELVRKEVARWTPILKAAGAVGTQ